MRIDAIMCYVRSNRTDCHQFYQPQRKAKKMTASRRVAIQKDAKKSAKKIVKAPNPINESFKEIESLMKDLKKQVREALKK